MKYLLPLILCLALAACWEDEKPTQKNPQAQKAAAAANSINFVENAAEIDNIKKRLELTSDPGLTGFILLLNEAGQPIMYAGVKGKITSGGKRLTMPVQQHRVSNSGYSGTAIGPAPSDEGTWGESASYVFFLDHGWSIHPVVRPLSLFGQAVSLERKTTCGQGAMTGVDAYPLCWPVGRPRTQYPKRSRFETTFSLARDCLMQEIRMLGGKDPVLSTNIPLRRDGLPLANHRMPHDLGVAVYFTYRGRQMCFACDQWDRIQDNIHAIRKTIEALRGIARWGTGDMMERAFTGFEALPAPGAHAKRQWWQVLGVSPQATAEEIKTAYRKQAMACHPDHGGNEALMAEVNAAYSEASRAA